MNTLTIPELNLFNSRRMSPTKRDFLHPKNDQVDNNHYHLTRHLQNSRRDDINLFSTINQSVSSQSRYKQIAETYLQNRSKLPLYPIQPTPYMYSIPSYLYYPSSELNKKHLCQCQVQIPHKDSINPSNKLHRHPYVGLKEQSFPIKQPKILKQPYLQATFRQRKPSFNHQQFITKQNTSSLLRKQPYQQKNIFINNEALQSKIMDKLKTHQSNEENQSKIGPINNLIVTEKHQVSIQTDNKSISNSPSILTSRSQYHNQRQSRQSRASVQRILQEQKMMIQSLKMEFQRQSDFKFHVQDLQTTKNDYIDRSRELLFKLNELADDKRDFAFIFKAFSDKRKHNVFGSLEV